MSKFEAWPDTCHLYECIEYEPDAEELDNSGPTTHKAMISDNVILVLEEQKSEMQREGAPTIGKLTTWGMINSIE